MPTDPGAYGVLEAPGEFRFRGAGGRLLEAARIEFPRGLGHGGADGAQEDDERMLVDPLPKLVHCPKLTWTESKDKREEMLMPEAIDSLRSALGG